MLEFVNPATGLPFGQVETASPDEARLIHKEMRAAFDIWHQKSVKERVAVLRKLQKAILDNLDDITAVLNQDCGKSRQDALIEVFITVDMLDQYCKRAPHWLRRQPVSRGLYLFKKCYVEYRPYGVVLIIAPWNYPFALSIPPVIAALLGGNTVVLKPSEVTAASGEMMERLFKLVPELSPYVRVVHGGGDVGAALVQSGPDYIFLTGSMPTGKKVMATAAETLTPVACELGGKDAMIVLEDADLRQAAHWGAWGAYFNSGQTCMAVERVYAVEAIYDAFVRMAVEETEKIKVGFSTEQESQFYMGPITDPRQLRTIRTHLDDALAKGARILTGGEIDGMFVEPTVMVDVDHSMLIMQDETFGPILPIMKVKDEAEAIRMANDCHLGLGASIWSREVSRAERVAHQVEASSIVINDTIAQFGVPMLPFGGIKQSGYGRIHGREGLMQFTRPYAYAVGAPPPSWDIATILRKPGHYRAGAAVMRLAFGVTPQQRIGPVLEAVGVKGKPSGAGLALGLSGAALAGGLALSLLRRPHRAEDGDEE
ncbi:MAG: aldehyde dehydrogenase family protein [Anaerolineae bacterium]